MQTGCGLYFFYVVPLLDDRQNSHRGTNAMTQQASAHGSKMAASRSGLDLIVKQRSGQTDNGAIAGICPSGISPPSYFYLQAKM